KQPMVRSRRAPASTGPRTCVFERMPRMWTSATRAASSSARSAFFSASTWKPSVPKISCAVGLTFSRRRTLILSLGKDVLPFVIGACFLMRGGPGDKLDAQERGAARSPLARDDVEPARDLIHRGEHDAVVGRGRAQPALHQRRREPDDRLFVVLVRRP